MTAHHFFLGSVEGDVLSIEGDDARHASSVLRIEPGERITISDGAGAVAEAVVTASGSRALTATVEGRRHVEAARPRMIVCPALPKSGKLDLVVQKLVELGVDEIKPWSAARSVARWDEQKSARNTERLRAIAYEAAKQSRRAWLPTITEPSPPPGGPDVVVLHEAAGERLTHSLPEPAPESIVLVVGPEGGLAEGEVELLASAGVRVASLGPQILRTETAAIASAAIVLAHYGRLG